jgi:hypothetical protein
MHWLITTQKKAIEAELDEVLLSVGAHRIETVSSVPLGQNEIVWEVEGPVDLDGRLRGVRTIREIFPYSSPLAY